MDPRINDLNIKFKERNHTLQPMIVGLGIQTMEECAELTQALSKMVRAFTGDATLQKDTPWLYMLTEEMADVKICMDRLMKYFDVEDDVEEIKDQKISRTLERLK